MKAVKDMTVSEFAAHVASHLKAANIDIVLSGGTCVSIYSHNRYCSYDLDFIERLPTTRGKIDSVLIGVLGFKKEGRHYTHPDSMFFVEFPSGPLAVGREPVKEIHTRKEITGEFQLISPTDCVKDRLSAFFHWQDRQSLEQACSVVEMEKTDMREIERWAKAEGMAKAFGGIKNLLLNAEAKRQASCENQR